MKLTLDDIELMKNLIKNDLEKYYSGKLDSFGENEKQELLELLAKLNS